MAETPIVTILMQHAIDMRTLGCSAEVADAVDAALDTIEQQRAEIEKLTADLATANSKLQVVALEACSECMDRISKKMKG